MPVILFKLRRVTYWGNADQRMDFTNNGRYGRFHGEGGDGCQHTTLSANRWRSAQRPLNLAAVGQMR